MVQEMVQEMFTIMMLCCSIFLHWEPSADAVSYRVHYITESPLISGWVVIDLPESDTVTLPMPWWGTPSVEIPRIKGQYTLKGLTRGKRYFVAVSAIDQDGNERMLAPVHSFIAGEKYESQRFQYPKSDQELDHPPVDERSLFWLYAPKPESDRRPEVRPDDGDRRSVPFGEPPVGRKVDI
jgi:hypothetical protein